MNRYPEYQPEEDFQEEFVEEQQEQPVRRSRRERTQAKKTKKAIALTVLVLGGIAAGSIFGTRAYHSAQETKRVDTLLDNYKIENYVTLPSEIISDRSYDISYADGEKIVDRLDDKSIEYININGQFYTKEGIPIKIVTFDVVYERLVESISVRSDGVQFYMPPAGHGIHDRNAWVGRESNRFETITRTVVLPADLDINSVTFPGAYEWSVAGEPLVLSTLPFETIKNSTLICDVPDYATLNENGECVGVLNLAPKKR